MPIYQWRWPQIKTPTTKLFWYFIEIRLCHRALINVVVLCHWSCGSSLSAAWIRFKFSQTVSRVFPISQSVHNVFPEYSQSVPRVCSELPWYIHWSMMMQKWFGTIFMTQWKWTSRANKQQVVFQKEVDFSSFHRVTLVRERWSWSSGIWPPGASLPSPPFPPIPSHLKTLSTALSLCLRIPTQNTANRW